MNLLFLFGNCRFDRLQSFSKTVVIFLCCKISNPHYISCVCSFFLLLSLSLSISHSISFSRSFHVEITKCIQQQQLKITRWTKRKTLAAFRFHWHYFQIFKRLNIDLNKHMSAILCLFSHRLLLLLSIPINPKHLTIDWLMFYTLVSFAHITSFIF